MDWEDTSPSEEDTLSGPGDTPEWLRGLDPTADDPPIPDQTISDEEAEDESREEASELGEAPEWLREMELSAAPGTASYEQPQVGDEEQAIIQIPDWLKEAKGTESSEPPDEPEEESEAHRGGEPEVESGPGLQDKAEVEREREPPPEPETRPELGRTAEPRDLPRSEPDIESEVHREPKPADEIQGALETEPEPEPSAEPDAGPEVEAEAEPQRPPEADPGIESEAPIEPRPETGPALTPEEDTEEESEDEPEIEADLDEELSKLRDRSGTEMAAWEGAAESTRLSPESVELPDWVKEAGGWAEEEPATEEPQAEESSEATDPEVDEESPIPKEEHWESAVLPDWAEEVQGGPEESPPEGEQSPFATAAPETTEAPGWLSGLLAPGPQEAREPSGLPPEPGLAEEDWESDLERAEIPEWLLGLKPGQDEKKAVVRGPVETEGLLRGLRGVIPSTSIITAPADFEGLPTCGPSEASLARAELLQSILGQAASTPRRGTREQAENTTGLVERWLVAGLLILTVLSRLVVLATADQPPRLTQPLTSPSAVNVHSAVDELAAGDKVLVAFDYGPAEVDELNPAAEPVLKHILDRGATLSIVSTRPDGPLVAEGFMSRITGAEGQYTIVGYRPGAASGVSQLLTAGDTSPDLLLILTGRAMPLRLWIEQARALYGERLPLATVGSAALEPVTSAYLDANVGQLTGAVHGLQGAASYETLRGIAGAATRRLDVLAAGHIAIVVLIIIGAVVCAVGGTEREEA